MIFYLRNNRVIARFKRIDNARPHRRQRPLEEEKLQRDREREPHGEKGITEEREGEHGARGGEGAGQQGLATQGWKEENGARDGESERRGEEVKGEL